MGRKKEIKGQRVIWRFMSERYAILTLVFSLLVFVSLGQASSADWVITTIDNDAGFAGVPYTIKTDSNSKAHIVYTSDNGLKYATNATGSWVIQTIDAAGGERSSVAVYSSNKVHISYDTKIFIVDNISKGVS